MDIDAQKRAAAARALEFVRPGMRLGLGTGSTARHFVELLGERVRDGLDVDRRCRPRTRRGAMPSGCGVPLTTLDETPELDLTVDGADEIAPDLSLIKGGGGALLREKIVAAASARMIVIADESKWVPVLGRFPLPVEVVPFGLGGDPPRGRGGLRRRRLRRRRRLLRRTKDGHAFVTDGGHWILDAALQRIADPKALAAGCRAIPGWSSTDLFIGLATAAVLAGGEGVRVVERS